MGLSVIRRQLRVHMHQSFAHCLKPESAPDLVHRDVRLQLFLSPLRILKKTELIRIILHFQVGYPYSQAPDRPLPAVILPEESHRLPGDLLRDIGGHIHLVLSGKSAQFGVPDIDFHYIPRESVPSESGGHALRQHIYHRPDVLFRRQVPRRGSAVSDALYGHLTAEGGYRRLMK